MMHRWRSEPPSSSERKEPALSQDDLFVRFMRHLPGMAWLKDLSGRFVYANEAADRALRGEHATLIGKRNSDLMSPILAAQCDASDREAMSNEAGVQVLEQFVDTSGAVRTALVSKFPVGSASGGTTLIGGMAIDITERIQAEERLRLSEERLRLATETGKVGVWDWDIRADRILWTPSLYQLHGVSPDTFEANLQSYAQLVHPQDRGMVERAIAQTLERDTPYELEFRAIKPDGEVVWLYTSARAIREDGAAIRLLGATLDITDRKRTELALRESEERFVKAFASSPLSVTLTSLQTGELIEVNQSFVNVSGYSREEAIGRRSTDLGLWMNEQDRSVLVQSLVEKGHVRNLECRLRTRGGEEVIGLLSAERIVIGGAPCALTVIQDITERARANAALRQSEERLRLALRAASAGVWSMELDEGEMFWSEEFRRLYGLEDDLQPDLQTWLARVHPEDRDRMAASHEVRPTSADREFRQEFRIVHPELGTRWILDLGRIERDDSGKAKRLMGINLDVTRAKEVEEELREADQRKNRFLATLAHELRNPLAPIRNGLEILRLTQGTGEAAEQARSMMDRQLRQMVRLIDDLLDLSRISRGTIELRRETVDIAAAIQSSLEISKPMIDRASHELIVRAQPSTYFVNGDMTRLAQIFANLLNNAAKYTPNGGRIEVELTAEDRQVLISVRDDGIGIDPAMLPRVFEMFTQVERTSEMAQGGLGIGLSIAKQLVEMHGGTIEAHSEGHAKGSEFIVRLPMVAATQSAASSQEQRSLQDPARGLRILIADDNQDAATSLALMLELEGHDVRTTHDGPSAIERAQEFRPDVILLDIGMPGLDGYETCRHIRTLPELRHKLMIALTGWGQNEDKRRSQEAGFNHHLVKPVEAGVLEKLIAAEQARLERN